ncbi:MAG: Amidohydrolase 2 [Chloroflexi bacterium]|nr:MAG: Amidohydrolase 2 [Chloroflexota bacterium]MBA4375655.1 hypothetical protein [Anaerolinea sp.]
MIIDSHTHVWVQQPGKYPWSPLGGYVPETEAPIKNLLDVMEVYGVEGAVLVQPTPYGWNNRYLVEAAKTAPDKLRTVGLVDPMNQQNDIEMKRLVKLGGVNGFRLNWHLQPVSVWEQAPAHLTFWKTARELNRPICIQCTLDYVPLLASMCQRFPQVRVVVDHLARLNPALGITDINFQQLLSLAQGPNTYIKISGLHYCSRQSPPYEDIMPFIQAILDSYGVNRCLWGSDFPFIQEHWDYESMLTFIKQIVMRSKEDVQWLLGNTASNLWW